ncbi:MAG: hypothetical protein JWM68_5755, partial [Verrucomicrobiales bacterium]|nr:hypothetical protein [Verrucomicrobiales bacterium]
NGNSKIGFSTNILGERLVLDSVKDKVSRLSLDSPGTNHPWIYVELPSWPQLVAELLSVTNDEDGKSLLVRDDRGNHIRVPLNGLDEPETRFAYLLDRPAGLKTMTIKLVVHKYIVLEVLVQPRKVGPY